MTERKVVTVMRLHPAELRKLTQQFGGAGITHVTANTTELEAGFKLGVSAVLDALRAGLVVEDQTT